MTASRAGGRVGDTAPNPAAPAAPARPVATGHGRLAAAIAVNIAIMSAIFGFVSWLPTFFASAGRDIAGSTLFAAILSLGAPAGTAIGFVVMLLPFAIVHLFAAWGQAGAILLIGSILLISAAIVARFGVVTRGRSLETV